MTEPRIAINFSARATDRSCSDVKNIFKIFILTCNHA